MDAPHLGGLGGTYGGAPVACAAAIAAVEEIRKPAFLAHARAMGDVMRREMTEWKSALDLVGDVRGLGPMMLVELCWPPKTTTPAPAHALSVIKRCVSLGVVLIRAGLYSNCIRFMPPLTISEAELVEALAVVRDSIAFVEKSGP
jgi:4-aminobutyrate aminotransferase / (S)-3-amino-2-methylpropionate transaminase / 5-aminovalerate transaminase